MILKVSYFELRHEGGEVSILDFYHSLQNMLVKKVQTLNSNKPTNLLV